MGSYTLTRAGQSAMQGAQIADDVVEAALHIAADGVVTPEEVASETGIPVDQARAYLEKLCDWGYLEYQED